MKHSARARVCMAGMRRDLNTEKKEEGKIKESRRFDFKISCYLHIYIYMYLKLAVRFK
jgi:hypothetical protein